MRTDGEVVFAVRRAYRYLLKIEHLPASRYPKATKETRRMQFAGIVDDVVASIEAASHAGGKKIAEVVRACVQAGQINSIAVRARPHLNLPRNWQVVGHELEHIE